MHYINIIMYYVFDKWQTFPQSHKTHLESYEILDEDIVGGDLISSKSDLLMHHD